jgi:hypothetical protein
MTTKHIIAGLAGVVAIGVLIYTILILLFSL